MLNTKPDPIHQFLRQLAVASYRKELAEGQLLERFLVERDEVAFAALVQRHGPMVYNVCRRLLPAQDAQVFSSGLAMSFVVSA